jgi:hypothetical protein
MSSRKFLILLSVAAATAIVNVPARAGVVIAVDKSSQLMSVSVDGVARHRWAVSTARAGYPNLRKEGGSLRHINSLAKKLALHFW